MTSSELKSIKQEIGNVWEQMKTVIDKQTEEIKSLGESKGETTTKLENMEKKLEELELKAKAPIGDVKGNNSGVKVDEKQKKHINVYSTYLREGKAALTPEDVKTMTVTDKETGGYFAMPEIIEGEILENITEYDPIRTVARIRTTSNRSVIIRRKTDNITGGYWTGEVSSRQDLGSFKYGQLEIPVYELAGYVDISRQDLDDAAFDLEGELNKEFTEQFGLTEGSAFLSGTGVNKPLGILTTNTDSAIDTVANGHATELQADALIDAVYYLKPEYARNGTWLTNRSTLKVIRKLKDGEGRYIWTPNLDIQKPPTILERPYVECTNMPEIAANAFPLVFGDIKRGYMIVDRQGITVMKDEYTQAGTGTVRFYGYKRTGGSTIKKEAMCKIKISVS